MGSAEMHAFLSKHTPKVHVSRLIAELVCAIGVSEPASTAPGSIASLPISFESFPMATLALAASLAFVFPAHHPLSTIVSCG